MKAAGGLIAADTVDFRFSQLCVWPGRVHYITLDVGTGSEGSNELKEPLFELMFQCGSLVIR